MRPSVAWLVVVALVVAAACTPSDSVEERRSAHEDALPVPPDTVVPPDHQDKVATGTLPGRGQVTPDGAAHYSIPLWVPPGRAGMAPELSVEYGSRSGNGPLGVGFSLGGFSEITRCRRTHAIDGRAAPVAFDAGDALCLDGQRLIPVEGQERVPYYKTERDSFAKIVITGEQDSAPFTIVAYQKDGRILRYGGSDQHVRRAHPTPLEYPPLPPGPAVGWLLARAEDRSGNFIEYDYRKVSGGLYPDEIRYTGSSTMPSLKANRSVRFLYQKRGDLTDHEVSTAMGYADLTQRLARIEMWGPDTQLNPALLRAYQLTYAKQQYRDRRSRIQSVHSEDARGIALSATDFDWETGEEGFEAIDTGITDLAGHGTFEGFRLLDFDNDGMADLLYTAVGADQKVTYLGRLSTGRGFDAAFETGTAPRIVAGRPWKLPMPMLWSSGRVGVVMTGIDLKSKAAKDDAGYCAWEMVPFAGRFQLERRLCRPPNHDVFPMDMDGNGLADLISGYVERANSGPFIPQFDLFRNAGGAFDAPVPIAVGTMSGDMRPAGVTIQMRGVDTDGDGTQELVACETISSGTKQALVIRPSGSAPTQLVNCVAGDKVQRYPLFFDANGDGLDDVVYTVDPGKGGSSGPTIGMKMLMSRGPQAPPIDSWERDIELTGGVRVIDYDLDGHDDLLATRSLFWNSSTSQSSDVKQIDVYRTRVDAASTGISYGGIHFEGAALDIPFNGATASDFEAIEVGDVNGDGMQDFLTSVGGTTTLYLRKGKHPRMLTRVVDGLGAEVAFDYAPISDRAVYREHYDCKYPQRCINGGLWVVSEHRVSNGAVKDGTRRYLHRYEGAVEDMAGRGFLGFQAYEVEEVGRGRRARYQFDLETQPQPSFYPYAGMPVREEHEVFRLDRRVIERSYEHRRDSRGVYWSYPRTIKVTETDLTAGAVVRGSSTTQAFDEFGNLLSATTTLANGDVSAIANTFENQPNNWLIERLTRVVRASTVEGKSTQRTTAYRYDGRGLVTDEVSEPGADSGGATLPQALPQPQADGVKTLFARYVRASDGQIQTIEAEEGVTPAAGQRATYVLYDPVDRVFPTKIQNSLGHATQLAYHPGLGVLAASKSASGVYSRWQYDSFGRIKATKPDGGYATTLAYRPYPGLSADPKKGSLELTETAATGRREVVRFDLLERPVMERVHERTDGQGVETKTFYDKWGQVDAVQRPAFQGASWKPVDLVEYDPLGRVSWRGFADGRHEEFFYHGLETLHWDHFKASGVAIRTTLRHDSGGRLLSSVQHVRAHRGRPARDLAVTYGYGPFGAVERITNHAGVVEIYQDRLGRKRTLIDPSLGRRDYAYNGFGELMTETLYQPAEQRQYTRDALGRVKSLASRDGKTEYAWDTTMAGHLGWVKSPQGVETSLGYDALGRPASRTWKVDGKSYALSRGYDAHGRIDTLTYPQVGGQGLSVRYEYGPGGALKAITDAAAATRYWSVLETDASGAATNPSGGFPRFELGNGIVTQRMEDAARPGLVGAITSKRGAAFIQNLGYGFDRKGNLSSRGDGVLGVYEGFGYDELNRLEIWSVFDAEVQPGEGPPHVLRYEYDDLGNLTGQVPESGPMRKVSYEYKRTGGAGPYAVTARNSWAYAYDGEGNQTYGPDRAEVKFGVHGLPLRLKATIEAEGSLGPNGLPRKTRITADTEFQYDGFESRVLKRNSSGEETISLGGVYERRRSTGGQVTHAFIVEAPSGPAAQVMRSETGGTLGPSQVLYLHQDHLGSTDVVTDQSGNVVERMKFDPLGARVNPWYPPLAGAKAAAVRIGFTGHTHDDEVNLINMGGRVYDPSLGRFASPDPLVESPLTTEGLNRYAYVRNNPLTLTDPTGFQADTGETGAGGDPPPPGQIGDPLPGFGTPSAGPGGGWTSPPAYNPANEVGARRAAAQVTYRPDLSRNAGGRRGVGQPGFLESIVPMWGSGRASWDHFENGRWGWGALYGVLAVTDVFLLKAIGTAVAKGVGKLAGGVGTSTVGRQVAERSLAPSSRALGRALEAAGHVRSTQSAAHHIVAGNAPAAAQARAILQRFGIGMNEAANGVFLPASRAASNAAGAAVHSTIHTNAYYRTVNQMLGAATTRAEVEAALGAIGQSLLSGGL